MQKQKHAAIDAEATESVEQLAAMWRTVITERGGDIDIRELPGLTMRWANNAFPFWNTIIFTEKHPGHDVLAGRLRQGAAYMRTKSQPGLIWLFEEYLEPAIRAELPAIAAEAGLKISLTLHGMAGDILPIAEPSHPALEFVRVTTDEHLRAYADINSRGYGFPLEAGRAGLEGLAFWRQDLHAWLGLENGVPVSCAATGANEGCLFLALVATTPEAQGKGYGEATTRKALYEGARATGLTRTTLHATDAGLPVYTRIGYHKVATIPCLALA